MVAHQPKKRSKERLRITTYSMRVAAVSTPGGASGTMCCTMCCTGQSNPRYDEHAWHCIVCNFAVTCALSTEHTIVCQAGKASLCLGIRAQSHRFLRLSRDIPSAALAPAGAVHYLEDFLQEGIRLTVGGDVREHVSPLHGPYQVLMEAGKLLRCIRLANQNTSST